jgi:hypothetical protein
MAGQPGSDWSGHDLATMLGIKPHNLLTQLGQWTRYGFLVKPAKAGTPSPNQHPGRSPPRQARNPQRDGTI